MANDTGGAVAQVFAARYPGRIRTLTLTNCDVHDNFPPELSSRSSSWPRPASSARSWPPWRATTTLARSEAGFGQGYAAPRELTDELLTSYLGPFVADGGKGLERFLVAPTAEELIAVEPLLAELQAPAGGLGHGRRLLRAGLGRAAARLIPGIERVTLVPDAMLFWPDERAADLVPLLRDFWEAHA